ncbi:hypothetical protein N0V83_010016 [Neocucurbitaria cava]|uniref:DUF2264 domain-containing protein n=1 Tax=Neocucurbitaria cava TaxID=798079 RepID=A0A9W8Y0K9_9PLEO|nr:hypothetical protein N0V83_010016 [Neocucurbitaria cava]
MAPLQGFSDNPFRTRSDLIRAAVALVHPLHQYKSPQFARIKIATSTGANFSETAAQLEGFARPLLVVAGLLGLKTQDSDSNPNLKNAGLDTWISGLKAGTDPDSPEYWGDVFNFDQKMVEMESIAYALLSNPGAFSFSEDTKARANIVAWLRQINEHQMPQNNWLWFRVFANLALVKTLGVPLEEVKRHSTFYVADGWSSDGLWGDDRKQADYYSGSFAIQFAQLLFLRFAPEYDPERTEKYKLQAQDFAKSYWRYFAPAGEAIPFGRSLTYRFAFAAFWGVAAIAGVDLPRTSAPSRDSERPLITASEVVGKTASRFQHGRDTEYWSVYWCLKSFLVLELEETHPFWSSEELEHPSTARSDADEPDVKLLWPPRHIMCNTPQHTFLLSSGQSTRNTFKAREAKYGKFAYSSAFAFSVPCGRTLQQIAPDSTLTALFDDGEDNWKVHWDPYDVRCGKVSVGGSGRWEEETVPTLTSTWRPWMTQSVSLRTTLVSPMKRWPGWSLRVHRVEWDISSRVTSELKLIDSGFAISAQTKSDKSIFEMPVNPLTAITDDNAAEGWWSGDAASLIVSESGASGVVDLTAGFVQDLTTLDIAQRSSLIIQADPNT